MMEWTTCRVVAGLYSDGILRYVTHDDGTCLGMNHDKVTLPFATNNGIMCIGHLLLFCSGGQFMLGSLYAPLLWKSLGIVVKKPFATELE